MVLRAPCRCAGVILQEMTRNEDELPADVVDEYTRPHDSLFFFIIREGCGPCVTGQNQYDIHP